MRRYVKKALLLASCLSLTLASEGWAAGSAAKTYWGFGDEFFDDFFGDFFGDDFFYGSPYGNRSGVVQNENTEAVDTGLGSAGELEGKTLIISLFLNDDNTRWTNDEESLKLADNSLKYLKIATDWICEQAENYDKHAEFIYDWRENQDLFHTGTISADLTDLQTSFDWAAWEYIDENIDSKALKEKYDADSVLYMVYVHTPLENTAASCARSYYRGMSYPYEMCFMCTQIEEAEENPASYAHEILHAFGAKDLYEAYQEIPQTYVDFVRENNSNEIMFAVGDPDADAWSYESITQEISGITAYYLGWTDTCEDVKTYGLARSEHDTIQESTPYGYTEPYGEHDDGDALITGREEDAVSV